MSNGWDASAQAWIHIMGEKGDWGRRYVLDAPMLARVRARPFRRALDLGCGEGRFCRMLQNESIQTVGIDPTAELIEHARKLDPLGEYHQMSAEQLSLPAQSVDLVVAYLSLIDIADLRAAIAQVWRALEPGGIFLIANLEPFNTASVHDGWSTEPDGSRRFCIDHYLQERPLFSEWCGIRIQNWHRPLQSYMSALLEQGFSLRHFAEPEPVGANDAKAERYRRVPNFLMMEWQKIG